jgi:hypothetical protein
MACGTISTKAEGPKAFSKDKNPSPHPLSREEKGKRRQNAS